MSDFSYSQEFLYLATTGFYAGYNNAGTITDLDGDDEFETGDTFGSGTYVGTMTLNGVVMPVFFDGTWNRVYNPDPDMGHVLSPEPINSGNYAFCFAAGTMIRVPAGESAVETLKIGDKVNCQNGGTVAIKWIGRQTIFPAFAGPHMQPVHIRAGALGDGLPHSDL